MQKKTGLTKLQRGLYTFLKKVVRKRTQLALYLYEGVAILRPTEFLSKL